MEVETVKTHRSGPKTISNLSKEMGSHMYICIFYSFIIPWKKKSQYLRNVKLEEKRE